MSDKNPKKIKSSKKQRELTPQELGRYEMHAVYTQLVSLRDQAFGDDDDDIDEDTMTDEQQHIIMDIQSLESEWILDDDQRAHLSVIQFTED